MDIRLSLVVFFLLRSDVTKADIPGSVARCNVLSKEKPCKCMLRCTVNEFNNCIISLTQRSYSSLLPDSDGELAGWLCVPVSSGAELQDGPTPEEG